MKRYAAKLLFQFRVRVGAEDGKHRLCEERIVLLNAATARAALAAAKRAGRDARHSYPNTAGGHVHFEFVGVMELLCLDPACGENEVWYELKGRLCPMERKEVLIPAESDLNAIRAEIEPGNQVRKVRR